MKISVFLNNLGLGGTEKAACRWARGLKERGHSIAVLALKDGARRAELEAHGIDPIIVQTDAAAIAATLANTGCEVIHAHAPGFPHEGDILGDALALISKVPVVQTNIFGRFENVRENAWTDFRLFISWTSCVQASRRAFRKLDRDFFRRASVAVYPLDPDEGPGGAEVEHFRREHNVAPDEILFGRLSRPEPNKWMDLPVAAFRLALKENRRLKLLLREPPPEVARQLGETVDSDRFLILPSTSDQSELRLTMASLDAVLHTSSIGESFGYGIAEPMNYAKPVITNSTPWLDQAQIELVRHAECGFVASTAHMMARAILSLAADREKREWLGRNAQRHVREVANTTESLDRLEGALSATIAGRENPRAEEDLARAKQTAAFLDAHQFGHTIAEQAALRPFYYRVRFHQWRKAILQPRAQP